MCKAPLAHKVRLFSHNLAASSASVIPDQRYPRSFRFLASISDLREMSDQMSDNRIVPRTDVEWAHWKATSIDDGLSMRCPFCPCFRFAWKREVIAPSLQERNLMFHCRRSGFQNEAEGVSLCLFCQHLDPGQLFSRGYERQVHYDQAYICLGTYAELEARRQCAFCHIVMCTIRADAAVYRTKKEHISGNQNIYIGLDKSQGSSINLFFDYDNRDPMVSMPIKKVLTTRPDLIREVNQVVGTSVSWKQIRRWIDSCNTMHTECRPTVTAPPGIRLIDVRDRKITPQSKLWDRPAFVALSYVWGKNIDSRKCVLLKENTTQLEQTNGLGKLPKTIEDAMTICENLGERFLWVDRLCIVQDDEVEKGHQIHAMADIFQAAALTLVAASGDSMESPIPGVSTDRQTFQSQMRIACLQVNSTLPRLARILHGASWSQRGWTYQESVLSPRKLYFTDFEVWLTCSDGIQREDVSIEGHYLDAVWRNDISMTQLHKKGTVDVMVEYWSHVKEYTRRSLTYQSDIYNAFTGILTALFGEDKSVYGLPVLYFDKALLWRLSDDTSTWDIRHRTGVRQYPPYPSWAWSSINGRVRTSDDVRSGEYLVSLVLWSLVDEEGNIKTIDIKFEEASFFQMSLVFAWRGGCFEAPLPSDLQGKLEFDANDVLKWAEDDLRRRWPTRKEFLNEVRSQGSPHTQVPSTIFEHLRPGMLLTRSQTAVPRLGTYQSKRDFEFFEILNEHGNMIGAVEASEIALKSNAEEKQRLQTRTYELMALSLSDIPYAFDPREISDEISSFLDGKGDVVLDNDTVKVLLISWAKNAPIARRVSIGWVYLKAWVVTKRTWKTIVLE